MKDIYAKIVELLRDASLPFQVLQHEPEGRTDKASEIRGHHLREAAKAMVVEVEITDSRKRYVLAVVSGDKRIDMKAVCEVASGRKARLAPAQIATALTSCAMGAVPPFSFHPALDVVADTEVTELERVVFNAGRLDFSIIMKASDYLSLSGALVLRIAQ